MEIYTLNKEFIKQRISVFAGIDVDPDIDTQVIDVLRRKFNIYLPQRPTLNESLNAAISDHEIISLITEYRTAKNKKQA